MSIIVFAAVLSADRAKSQYYYITQVSSSHCYTYCHRNWPSTKLLIQSHNVIQNNLKL
jgi:hypothetical protein